MKIAVLSDWELAGGANVAAVRLTNGFRAAGHDVIRIYQRLANGSRPPDVHLIPSRFATHELSFAKRSMWKMVPHGLQQHWHEQGSEVRLAEILDKTRPDVINVHNLHIGRWSPEMIRVCARYAPVVCKLCDTWTFTGRCYNPGPCEKYLTRCDESCPTASEYPSLPPGRIGAAFELRREILDGSPNVVAVAPSEWIGRMAAAGLWKSRAVFRIRNGIPLERYRPLDRASQRKSLGIPADAIVLLCCAGLLTERKKGLPLLLDALKLGLTRPVHLLLMGTPAPVPLIPNVEVHQLGYVTNDTEKAAVYSAADIYVHPSLADNSPNTIIESLACGTPSVAFPIDGVPEMVVPRETGWLANHVSAGSLQAVLSEAIEAIRSGDTLRDSSRRFAETHYEMMTVVRQYERLFGQLTSGTTVAPGLRTTA